MKIYKNLNIESLNGEIWKNIDEFEEYQISNLGRVKSFKEHNGTYVRILKQEMNNKGYLYVRVYKNKKPEVKHIHRLVYENFYEKLKENEIVHHFDENPENNYLLNLKSMDDKEHRKFHNKGKNNPMFGKKRLEHSKRMKGENHPMYNKHPSEETRKKQSEVRKGKYLGERSSNSKLTEEKVIEIWKDLNEGILTQKEIGKKFGIHNTTVSSIKTGRCWKHIKIKTF